MFQFTKSFFPRNRRARGALIFCMLLVGMSAQAADYNFSDTAQNLPAGCSGRARDYACAALSLAAGDSISIAANQPTTITFSGAFDTGGGVLINAGGSTSDLTMVANGAVTLGAGSILTGNLSTQGTGVVTVGIGSWISGNVSTEIGDVVIGANKDTMKTGVGGNISTVTGYVSLGAGATVGGAVTTTLTGYVSLGASATVGGAVSTVTGYVSLGEFATIGGAVTTTSAGYVSLGASAIVNGNISTGAAGYVTTGASSSVTGLVSTSRENITIGAKSDVYAVCCRPNNNELCVIYGLELPRVPLVCVSAAVSSNAARFECMESGSSLPARLFTKLAGTPFAFDVVALKADGTLESNYVATGGSAKTVTLEWVEGSGSAACADRSPIASSQTVGFVFADAGRKTAAAMAVGDAYANLRCRVTDATTTPTCSSDNFAVRPAAFLVGQVPILSSPTLVAGSPFTLQARAVMSDLTSTATNYMATPTLNLDQVTGTPGFTPAALAPQLFAPATNGVSSATFTYDEVGSFTLPATSPYSYGVSDSSFTTVDGSTDCNAHSVSNTLDSSGKYGCVIGQSAPLTVGRFYPDHFDTAPAFTPACAAGGFTYMDQAFTLGYTVTARSLSRTAPNPPGNIALTLYSGGQLHLAALNAGTDWVARLSPAVINPVTWSQGSYTPASNSMRFTRPTSTADASWGPFEALNIGVAVDDADGAGFAFTASTDSSGLTFDGTTPASCLQSSATACRKYASLTGGALAQMLLGRIKLKNAYGSARGPLNIPMAFEYWSSNGWRKNPLDTCSGALLTGHNFGFEFPAVTALNKLQACNTAITIASSGVMATYPYALTLSKPLVSGWADITLNLGTTAPGVQCNAVGTPSPGIAPTSAKTATTTNMLWLQNSGANPKARATFGMFKSQLIYRRENY